MRKFLPAILLLLFPVGLAYGETLSLADKTFLHAAMQQHIDRSLVDGAYLHIDLDAGDIRHLYPVKAHPEILKMGRIFVLCSDFRDGNGKSVNVDFYLARRNRTFFVFRSVVDDRRALAALMDQGKVKRAE